jgi:death-on-curing protein
VASTSQTLTIDEILELNRQQIDEFGGLFLPFGNLHNRDSLEYAVWMLSPDGYGALVCPTLESKAAFLAHKIITNHVFHDGNKRTAMSGCRLFLLVNGFDLEMLQDETDEEVIDIAVRIAESNLDLEEFTQWVKDRMKPIE